MRRREEERAVEQERIRIQQQETLRKANEERA
jgi:hypothetical protein